MKKNIIFDWTGVIKDSVKSHLWIVNKIFKELGGKEISLEELKENWEQPHMNFYNRYIPDLTFEKEEEIYKKAILDKDCPKSKAFPGIIDFIKRLKEEGYFIAVISSDLPETILLDIKEYGLEDIFDDFIFNIYDKTEALMNLIEKNKLNPKETFFIGDSNCEIESALKVGAKSIAVTWGLTSEEKLRNKNPNFIVKNLKELEEIVFKDNH
jgi:pyrophosphatase PpaX